jgi:hypothetical protein
MSHRLTVAILGALPIPSPAAFRQAFWLASGVVLFVKGIIPILIGSSTILVGDSM